MPVREVVRDSIRLPRVPRLTKEIRQRGQMQYLSWRLDMYLKDYGATRADRKEWIGQLRAVMSGPASYEDVCRTIEGLMLTHLDRQVAQIRAIFQEKTD